MSQRKVDAYKVEKANRDKLIQKEKRMLLLEKLVAALVCLAVVVWIGFSLYNKLSPQEEVQEPTAQETAVDITAIDNYLQELTAEE